MNDLSDPAPPRKLPPVVTLIAVVAILYLAKEFLLPLVLAILVSFLLAPLVGRFERWRMGRVFSVVLVTLMAMSVIGVIGYIFVGQMLDLANELPKYKTNLAAKIQSLKTGENSPITKASKTLRELAAQAAAPSSEKAAPAAPATPGGTPAVPIMVVDSSESSMEKVESWGTSLLGTLGTAAIVLVFVIFILLEREDLRDRIIHLVGKRRLHVTTEAMDDAAGRVSRYLFAQLVVNVSYGIPVGIGLYFIGIPNAILWGILAALVRFIPYLGPVLGATFPILLSLAVAPTWTAPLLTAGLFVVLELISNNAVEPWLYGSSTGLSSMAVIVSAAFWGWLWGPVGLLLATPLTVCIAVLGKYIPSLTFLDVLLGDKPPIALGDRLYQRLLALDEEESLEIVETQIKKVSFASAYDDVILPAIRLTEQDRRDGAITEEARKDMYALLRRVLIEVDETPPPPDNVVVPVVCLPASNEADELAAIMLAHLLEKRSVLARVVSCRSLASEMIELAVGSGAPLVCISAIPPTSVMPATYLCKRLRGRMPEVRIVVGLWREVEIERRQQRLKRVHADDIFVTLDKAAAEIALHAGLQAPPDAVREIAAA